MSCPSPVRELVTFFLAGTLSQDEARLVSLHLETCADCRADVADGRVVVEGLRELHLRADEVVAAAAGDLNSSHLLVCSRCRDEVALLRTVNGDLAASSRRGTRRWQAITIAALAAMAAVLAISLVPRRAADDHSTRSGSRLATVELLRATTAADGAPTFVWTPVDGATRYRVELFSEDGRSLWARDVDAPPVTWPADVPRAAGSYKWSVVALAGTTVVARSRLADLDVPR